MSDQRKILFAFWAEKEFGGAQRRYSRLASHIAVAKPDLDIYLLCPYRSMPAVKELIEEHGYINIVGYGFKTILLPYNLLRLFELIHLIIKAIYINPGRIHYCTGVGFNSFALFSIVNIILKDVKLTSVMNDVNFIYKAKRRHIFFAKITVLLSYRIDCLSEYPKNMLEKIIRYKDLGKLKLDPCSFSDYSCVLTSNDRDIDVIMLARFVEDKGYDLLEEIDMDIKDIRLDICGFGDRKIKLRNRKIYWESNPFEVLSRTKICLSLQKNNNYPSQTLLEAMASGCAIIATDVGETRKLVDENCAVLIEYDASALRDAILMLLNNDHLIEAFGKNARRRVLKEHTIERYASYFMEEIIAIYPPHHHRPF